MRKIPNLSQYDCEDYPCSGGGNDNLIILAPHSPCGFQTDCVCFFGCYLAGAKALVSVISDITAELAVTLFGSHHILIGSFCRAVDAADIHPLIRFVIVFDIAESVIQIFIEIFLIGGLVGITGIIDYFLQPVFDRPESGSLFTSISLLICFTVSFSGSKSAE